MLILSRKTGESVIIDGRIVVKIIRTDGDTDKVGIEAPSSIPVHRQEVYEEIQRANREAATRAPHGQIPPLLGPQGKSLLASKPSLPSKPSDAILSAAPSDFSPAANQKHSRTV
ncbi:MAG: carbon storage regulator CsrA [Verrucomicrobia bacterium]|nr:carbon storage regulator CsrA [Verrucomicrobiota bacterium]